MKFLLGREVSLPYAMIVTIVIIRVQAVPMCFSYAPERELFSVPCRILYTLLCYESEYSSFYISLTCLLALLY